MMSYQNSESKPYVWQSDVKGGSKWHPAGDLTDACSTFTDCGTCSLAKCSWDVGTNKCTGNSTVYDLSYDQFFKSSKICMNAKPDLCLIQTDGSGITTLGFKPGKVPQNHICMYEFQGGNLQFIGLENANKEYLTLFKTW